MPCARSASRRSKRQRLFLSRLLCTPATSRWMMISLPILDWVVSLLPLRRQQRNQPQRRRRRRSEFGWQTRTPRRTTTSTSGCRSLIPRRSIAQSTRASAIRISRLSFSRRKTRRAFLRSTILATIRRRRSKRRSRRRMPTRRALMSTMFASSIWKTPMALRPVRSIGASRTSFPYAKISLWMESAQCVMARFAQARRKISTSSRSSSAIRPRPFPTTSAESRTSRCRVATRKSGRSAVC